MGGATMTSWDDKIVAAVRVICTRCGRQAADPHPVRAAAGLHGLLYEGAVTSRSWDDKIVLAERVTCIGCKRDYDVYQPTQPFICMFCTPTVSQKEKDRL